MDARCHGFFPADDTHDGRYKYMVIDNKDKKIIRAMQGDLPFDLKPFEVVAKKIGITEEELIKRVRELKESGIIRRFGATLRHQEAGFKSNVMVAWYVPENRVKEAGRILARFSEVTHCYQRRPQGDWHYNLYTMIHGASRKECLMTAERMARTIDVEDYELLFSEKEFKKTSMEYY
jgi:DNA-binding Lrp family transcriptional regulator